ncbi:MAG: transglutaminase [Pseudozobellia sp.]|nr:transglutaminase [Pseudozobellia sp.]MBG48491.1 transglutaminase [Pseudozobellia sp.]|tara:strand:- start:767 stop:1621 length:855 start_codon:yes stop_codon:yes gene_type:complete
MPTEYAITYSCENKYENKVRGAHWQFLIIPQTNSSQEVISIEFTNSLLETESYSINGLGFKTIRLKTRKSFKSARFRAKMRVLKSEVNPFDFPLENNAEESYKELKSLNFRVDHEAFLKKTDLTTLPETSTSLWSLDTSQTVFTNLQNLNKVVNAYLTFQPSTTTASSTLEAVISKRNGVCQDFAHLFCALARMNGIPSRYVSGFLHQGSGYFGDSQMHAWAEAFIPKIGWVGFDPCNDLLAGTDYIKVSHGKDYRDCAPIRGVLFTTGKNETIYTVQVEGDQQ